MIYIYYMQKGKMETIINKNKNSDKYWQEKSPEQIQIFLNFAGRQEVHIYRENQMHYWKNNGRTFLHVDLFSSRKIKKLMSLVIS